MLAARVSVHQGTLRKKYVRSVRLGGCDETASDETAKFNRFAPPQSDRGIGVSSVFFDLIFSQTSALPTRRSPCGGCLGYDHCRCKHLRLTLVRPVAVCIDTILATKEERILTSVNKPPTQAACLPQLQVSLKHPRHIKNSPTLSFTLPLHTTATHPISIMKSASQKVLNHAQTAYSNNASTDPTHLP